ncbi:uncharacterized protein LOC143143231 isoform X2 [Ptiloglossa arizonensis]|uniref:uncharacterized protein LOC143143231 isoform X2 n=1 Tax=Ptiloglossa arizonensis TaxID=3350558 RepID=UPI003F9F8316
MVTCCVPTCGNSTRNFKLYVLPKDRELRIKWCVAICRDDLIDIDLQTRNRYRVCEVHFDEHEKIGGPSNKRHLRCTSCPTLKLPALKYYSTSNDKVGSDTKMPRVQVC